MFFRLRLRQRLRQCEAGQLPAYACEYYRTVAARPAVGTPLSSLRLVVFDTETSGLNPRTDQLLSLGAIALQAHEIILKDSFEAFFPAAAPPQPSSIQVHGILPSDAAQAPSEAQVLEGFLTYLGAAPLVGHHVAFDVRMLEQSMQAHAPRFRLLNHCLDTAHIAKRLELPPHRRHQVNPRDYSLDALCERYDLTPSDRHTAWGDALITAQLLLKLLHQARVRGITRLKDLL